MPDYPTLESVLQDAQLRLAGFGGAAGMLVVEGPDDKRLLCTLTVHRQQVLVANGRRRLLAAHKLAADRGMTGVAFLTDCDYEVARGDLSVSDNLIITEHADIEADLLDAFGFERLVTELVPDSLHSDADFNQISSSLKERTIAFADVLGRARMVALKHGCTIDTLSLRHHKYRPKNAFKLDSSRLIRTLVQNSPDCPIGAVEFEKQTLEISSGYDNCNGHDLAAVAHYVLRDDFGVRGETPESIEKLLRVSASKEDFQRLKLAQYINRWEQQNGRLILRS